MAEQFIAYRDFWAHYLREHSHPETRRLHFAGTAVATGSLLALAATGNGWLLGAAILGGYGPAWLGHFFIEHNKPATFTHPLWSLVSDYRMAWLWLAGRLDRELAKAGVAPR